MQTRKKKQNEGKYTNFFINILIIFRLPKSKNIIRYLFIFFFPPLNSLVQANDMQYILLLCDVKVCIFLCKLWTKCMYKCKWWFLGQYSTYEIRYSNWKENPLELYSLTVLVYTLYALCLCKMYCSIYKMKKKTKKHLH